MRLAAIATPAIVIARMTLAVKSIVVWRQRSRQEAIGLPLAGP